MKLQASGKDSAKFASLNLAEEEIFLFFEVSGTLSWLKVF